MVDIKCLASDMRVLGKIYLVRLYVLKHRVFFYIYFSINRTSYKLYVLLYLYKKIYIK